MPDDVLRAQLEPIVDSDAWVIDGVYQHKVGNLVLDAAELVVWLDLPVRVWLPRLTRRSWRRMRGREVLWHENKESFKAAFLGWDSLIVYALRTHVRRRREWPGSLAAYSVVRLRTPAEVERFLAELIRVP
jgi:hypothetical protein